MILRRLLPVLLIVATIASAAAVASLADASNEAGWRRPALGLLRAL